MGVCFINLLKKASKDNYALLEILEIIKPLIDKYSIINEKVDEELRSELTTCVIETLHKENFYKKIKEFKK